MKRTILTDFVVSLLVVALFLGKSQEQCLTIDDTKPPNIVSKLGLYTGQQGFSLNLLQAINQLMPSENLFFSPYSTYHALIISYFLAGNQTESYLKKVLRLDDSQTKIDVYNAYKLDKFTTMINAANASYEFTSANKIYVSDQVPIRQCIDSLFPEELEKTAFKSNPELARTNINQWVETRTHNMIKDLLAPGTIDSTTNLVLVNAAYFKGIWENKFDPNQTKPEIFYVSPSKQIMVDMMHVEGTFNHDISESLGAHILELPYQGKEISMYIFLPPFTKEDAVDATLKKLTLEKFKMIVENNSLISRTVQVSLPKFTLEQTIELVPILESLGVGNLFKSDADFSTLSNTKNISVGEGVHKARIIINEQGSQAAAATAFFGLRMMSSEEEEPVPFICNKPFIFYLYNKKTHTVLFSGIFRQPATS